MQKKALREQRVAGHKTKQVCRVCAKQISGGSAYFSFGAVIDLLVLKKKKLSDTTMEAFCDIGYHGVDSNVTDSANYCVADGIKGGQLDIHFCSLACLKKWFCDIVDHLESQLGQHKGGKPKRHRAPPNSLEPGYPARRPRAS
jgi:hypothetical protein